MVNRTLLRAVLALQVVVQVAACDRDPVAWDDAVPLPTTLTSSEDIAFEGHGSDRLVPRVPPTFSPPVFTAQCAASVRVARDTIGDWYATWWSVREDSTADIVVSRSDDGVVWAPPVRVDSVDAGPVGCRRPPPAISVNGGYVYVAYAMAAREGPGIFASHSMDRGMTFHSPVAVVYGERIGRVAIAARGDLVAIAYQDPNSDPPRIGLALSRTRGHTFEDRELVSPPTGAASAPGVALGDGVVAVTWARGTGADASAPRMLRIGTIR